MATSFHKNTSETATMDADASTSSSLENSGNLSFAFSALTSLFFMWGLMTSLNDILIPHLKSVFTLNYTQAMLIQFCFFMAYFIMSLPSGFLLQKLGYKKGIIVGLLGAATGCLLFYPAAEYRSYNLFLGAFFVLASGITLLQVSANPYVSILGSAKTASSRLNLSQAFNSLGTTVGPFLGSVLILSVPVLSLSQVEALSPSGLQDYQAAQASLVQTPYLILAGILISIALIISLLKLPEVKTETQSKKLESQNESIFKQRHLIFAAIAIFAYVGGEVSIGSFLVNFLSQGEIAGLKEFEAGQYVSLYWGGAMIGRFIGSAVLQKVKAEHVLSFNAFVAVGLILLTMFLSGKVAMVTVLSIGLFNSIMFPNIFTLGIKNLKEQTAKGAGILCMAIVGGAIMPLIQGYFADKIGIQHAFFIPVLCYLYILFFGLHGHKQKV